MENCIENKQTSTSPIAAITISLLLACGFLSLVTWFNNVDVYHNHFFETGPLVLAYNTLRAIFALYMIWIIFVPGYGILSLLTPASIKQKLTLTERFIFGFSIGIGFWHTLMLVLGVSNLYYQFVMVGICVAVLLGSGVLFTQANNNLVLTAKSRQTVLSGVLIAIAILWLFLIRGMYPGGGGDYFTHYFYYYLSVLHNHGLAPNDVWYHYYYSKGAGLHFLGMLLTDPEAPSIMTFTCVAVACIALANLVYRFSPRSLWPATCVILYVAYNLVQINGGGGEFQKSHEETTAIVILATWAICLYHLDPKTYRIPAFIALATLMIGAAILTQATVVFFALFFALQCVIALAKRNWSRLGFYVLLGALSTIAVLSILLLNYLVTGLASDQALDLTWRFANVEKLNQWGVIPNVILVEWIRHNYDLVSTPIDFSIVKQLILFMRLDHLYILLGITLFITYVAWLRKKATMESTNATRTLLLILGLQITLFAILSIFTGHSQSISYFRFCSFFFPIILLFCVLCWTWSCNQLNLTSNILPIALAIIVVHFWNHWPARTIRSMHSATRYFKGDYSIAEGYINQQIGLKNGGIHPGTLAAKNHTPPGSRIWSTSVDTYCMAPNCQIESIISFKLSPNMNEILNGTPETAEKTLKAEKLNYFIFTKNALLLDVLPYSNLFNPQNIKKHLAIKWTNGDTYLLTWPGPGKTPITDTFMRDYTMQLNKKEHIWFRFSKSLLQLNLTMTTLNQLPHPWHPIEFSWTKQNRTTQ